MMARQHITLWDIIKSFDPLEFMRLAYGIGATSEMVERPSKQKANNPDLSKRSIPSKMEKEVLSFYRHFEKTCIRLHLPMSAKAARRMINEVSKYSITYGEYHEMCQELKRRLKDEMELMMFYSVEPSRQQFLTDENPFGDAVVEAFPSAAEDIRNAAKCLAFGQWTASVFHSMLVMEIGLRTLATRLGVSLTRPNWINLITDIREVTNDIKGDNYGDNWRIDRQFYSEAVAHLNVVKDAWRNHVMHVDEIHKTYDEERAESIFRHTKEFMKHLAIKLKEDAA